MATDQPVRNQLDLVVRDVGASVAFYRRLGPRIPTATTSA